MSLQRIILLALQASIVLTVFGFGLQASWRDVSFVVRRPGLLARSLVALFVFMPLLAVLLVDNFELKPPVEIALVALSISPIPPVLPSKSAKAGGRRGYTIGLLATAALLSIVVVPLAAHALQAVFGLPFVSTTGAIAALAFKTVLLPMLAGMVFRAIAPDLAEHSARPIAVVANVMLTLGALVILVAAMPAIWTLIGDGTLLAMAAFVAAGLVVGHLLGGPDPDERVVLGLCTACRHPGIALAIATANYPAERLVGPAVLLYVLVGTVVGIPYVRRQRKRIAAASVAA